MVKMFLLLEMQLKNGTQQDYSHLTISFQRHFKHMQHDRKNITKKPTLS